MLENWFFGKNPPHRLRDALIEFYLNDSKAYMQRMNEKPHEPLDTSFVRRKTKDRFDYIFVSNEIEVIDCQYNYEGAISAGSDHAIVISNLGI